ncbi:MAG TPA: HAMP domain-containing histidine kinase [Calditrichaeota bacterium]|nr:HAMP domain-containing histidine kinase [Calditrichota bacterium]
MKSGEGSFVTDIMNCLDRLKKQIDNLLNYSQASDNKITVNKTNFSAKILLQKIYEECTPLVKRDKNQLKINCSHQGQIHSDKQLIKQIIYNLIDNALKHCDKDEVIVDCHSRDNHLIISVTDTGCGISTDNLENIFTPFWQVKSTSSKTREGSGLGLSICQLFAESLGGNISVTSRIHHGTVFTLSIPCPEKHH